MTGSDDACIEALRRLATPLEPIPTTQTSRIGSLEDIRAVMFDIYGTLFISGSGDIGISRQAARGEAFQTALESLGCRLRIDAQQGVNLLLAEIETRHQAARQKGIEYPEVDIVDVWRSVIDHLVRQRALIGQVSDDRLLAVEYEARTNPTWPMPGVRRCIQQLARAGLLLGIVSNAQFFTPLLFPALLEKSVDQWGFDPALQTYSYQWGQAKPGEFLYRRAAAELSQRGISPHQVVYVGNDLLNDVWPAGKVGFRTVLFAGDARSLRLRRDDPRTKGVEPDAVLTRLTDLPHFIRQF